MPAFLVHGEFRAHHVRLLVNARRTLLQEHTRALHVGALKVESAVCGALRDRCPRTRNTATSLTDVGKVVAGFLILQRRINPNAVLLTALSAEEVRFTVSIDEGVLAARHRAVRVGKKIAILILCSKIEGVVAGGAAKLVGLRGVDRRNRAVIILELHVHRGIIDAHSSLQGTRRRRFFETNNTRQNAKSIRHVKSTIDITVGDTIRFDNLGRIRDRSSSNRAGGLSLRGCCRLWGDNWMNKRRHKCDRKRSSSNRGAATASYAVKTLHFHEKSFLIKN